MKKISKILLEFGLMMIAIFTFTHLAAMAGYLPLPDEATEIYQRGNIPTPEGLKDTDAIQGGFAWLKIMVLNALSYFKVIIVVIGILYITIIGYRLVSSGDKEETITNVKKAITYAIIAFVIISMAEDIGKLFDMEKNTLLASPQEILNRVHLFDKQVEIIITFIKYVIGSYAVLMIIRSAIKMITAGGNDEEVGKHRKSIMYSAGGLILIYVGDVFVNKVFYKVDKTAYSGITGVHPSVDAEEGVAQLIGITNLVVSFVAPVAVMMLIVGAIMYATAGGDDDKMKKAQRLLTSTVIAIVIIYGAFALVSTVVSGKLGVAIVD